MLTMQDFFTHVEILNAISILLLNVQETFHVDLFCFSRSGFNQKLTAIFIAILEID